MSRLTELCMPDAVLEGLRESITAVVEHEVQEAKLRCEQRVRETVAHYVMSVGKQYSMEWRGTDLHLRVSFE